MGKRPVIMLLVLVLVLTVYPSFQNSKAWADVQWKTLTHLRLNEKPLDVDVSLDGENLYILVEGKLIIYSLTEAKGKYTIPVNKSLDTLKISEANGSVVLLSTAENLIEIIQLQFIPQFDVSGLPFRGADKAPVIIVTFIDYR